MDMSYQEKSIAGSLVAILVVYACYFAAVLRNVGHGEFAAGDLARLIRTVIAIIVIEVIYHIVLAIGSKPEKDERDVFIAAKAYRNAYFALATGAWMVIACLITASLLRDQPPTHILTTPFLVVNLVLLFMVIAEVTKFGTQLLYYCVGV